MNALTIKNLHKTYASGTVAVKGVDLTVAAGDFFCLLGPNGAGKTTIIGIISSLVNKTKGSVQIFDYDLDTQPNAAKEFMGLVPQELNFNQFEKVLDIVINQAGFYGIPYRVALPRVKKYLTQLGLWEKRHEMSRSLSGGMKRRLMIARALVHEPRLLILDEPTAGVDVELRRSTWDFLREINRAGVTIILTTHYLEEAETLCNGIAIINKGQVIERTTVKELLTQLPFETIVLDLQTPVADAQLPNISGINLRLIDATTLEAMFTKQQTLNALSATLTAQKIHVLSMRNKANRLEQLFLDRIKQN